MRKRGEQLILRELSLMPEDQEQPRDKWNLQEGSRGLIDILFWSHQHAVGLGRAVSASQQTARISPCPMDRVKLV